MRFRHLLIRDAAYSSLPKTQRAELHDRFGSALEAEAGDADQFTEILALHKKQQQLQEKFDETGLSNKRLRRRQCSKLNRGKVETSLSIRKIPFLLPKWKEFSKEIERAVEERIPNASGPTRGYFTRCFSHGRRALTLVLRPWRKTFRRERRVSPRATSRMRLRPLARQLRVHRCVKD